MHLYPILYALFDSVTPIAGADCGRLCGGACCKGEQMGMYLFPQEEQLFQGKPGFRVEQSDFVYGGQPCSILFCDGHCRRQDRPLACRIFPLVPLVRRGKLDLRLDPRGRGLCPLAYANLEDLNPAFVAHVRRAALLLLRHPTGRQYLEALTETIGIYHKL